MRLLLALLSFVALALAPLATPAQAMAGPAQTHCAEMAGMADHQPDQPPMSEDGKCCVAVPAALAPGSSPQSSDMGPRSSAVAQAVAQMAGLSSEAEDPPPRS
ncbi:MAG: hypothetical protein AVDCRST_MAG62-105 [uncultured Sphingomonas sp.]|uniref:Uncharacterized protein n=1 Tax=uncultured Sphingomonas sp. TaxID=158754 RepID=A0A6J4SRU2_9SPHN|nr:MAG: hypothetical protein AVDCRST_MAG62-105 [uncultured Sphingomonas sp.]